MSYGKKKLKDDLAGVVIPLYMVLIGMVVIVGVVLVAWLMGFFWILVGTSLIFLGAMFALQILPPRGWPGIIVGLIPIAIGLIIVGYAKSQGWA